MYLNDLNLEEQGLENVKKPNREKLVIKTPTIPGDESKNEKIK